MRPPFFLMATRPALFLGVDPGLNRTGYALLERTAHGPLLREGGIVRTTAKRPLAERLCEIGDGLGEIVSQYQPEVLAIEQVFSHAKFPKTAILMAHARGVILHIAASAHVPVVHYTPRQIKRLLTGSGTATKEQVQRAISRELGLDRLLEPNDVADAFAVALCHYHSVRLPTTLQGLEAGTDSAAIDTDGEDDDA